MMIQKIASKTTHLSTVFFFGSGLTSACKKTRVPLAIKRVRKQIPPPSRVVPDKKKKYSRKRTKEELERALQESLEKC